jgi:hypothetical protein
MGVVELACNMKSVASMRLLEGRSALDGTLEVRLRPMPAEAHLITPEIPKSHTWAWCIAKMIPGEPDVILVGGGADSMTEAAARGHEELQRQLAREGHQKGGY